MTKSEVAQLYSNRMHRSCVDGDVFNCWMLTDFQSDDVFIPAQASPLLRALVGLDDESAAVTVKLYAMDAERELRGKLN